MTKLRTHRLFTFATFACLVFVFCAATATVSAAQVTVTALVTFDGTNGSNPSNMVLAQGADGNFYGVTEYGGANNSCYQGCGTVFKMTPSGTLTTLYNFCAQANCADGTYPKGSLVQAADGDFYGVTQLGGNSNSDCGGGCGTIFKITPKGALTTLYAFCSLANCADGAEPFAGLVQAANGKFYGTNLYGGLSACFHGCGTVFEMSAKGKLTTLYSFCQLAECADGAFPSGPLVEATNGNFYGEAEEGGLNYNGTIFEISPSGRLTTLFTFDGTNGSLPNGGLIQANGDFYGVTSSGGSSIGGLECQYVADGGCGTVFEVTDGGELTTLCNFGVPPGCPIPAGPNGPLVQGTDGNFYGTVSQIFYDYPPSGPGSIYEVTSKGSTTTIYSFCQLANCADGLYPGGGMLQATNGTFYGTTDGSIYYGPPFYGNIFSLSTGLAPFAKTQPTSAKEGATIGILGQGFSSSSIVQFGGVQATSIKLSGSTFLEAIVPAGALTGSVTVTTDGATLTSNQQFRVTPKLLSFNPPSGSVGTQVTITGTGFTQTSAVGFGDNTPAEFTVNSDTQITATVPTGAQTGPIGVVTKGGTAVSSATFTVN
jgi:uncharacterized repeat protein (TIGR03803 family)